MKIKPIQILNLNDAILACNPNTKFTNEVGDGTKNAYCDYSLITWLDNSPEVSQADAEAKLVEIQEAENARFAKETADAKNGNDKLLELGLSQDQVTAMTGYTPPVEE
jgi:hypothetical protein